MSATPWPPERCIPCPSVAAYDRHRAHGEEPCDGCRKAKSAYVYAAERRRVDRLRETAPPKPTTHGTAAGINAHRDAGEPLCGLCKIYDRARLWTTVEGDRAWDPSAPRRP